VNRALIVMVFVAGAQQVGAAAPAGELSEVIVTARRVPEAATRVPLSVSVVGQTALGSGNVSGLQALAGAAPGLSYESLWGGFGSTPMIRGQSQPSAAGDNVGVFVDDVFQAASSSIDVLMLDFDRIEVVRGPQNTLFGRSTFAGAIHYVSPKPTAATTGYLKADLGSGLAGLSGAWSGRLAGQWLGRLALGHQQQQGTLESTLGKSLGDSRRDSAVLTVERQSADGTSSPVSLSARFNHGEFGHPASSTLNAVDYNCGARDATSGLWTYYCGRVALADEFPLTPALPDSHGHSEQVALQLEQPVGELVLRALSGYYHGQSTSYRDFDGSDAGLLSGVCTNGVNCGPGAAPLTRFVSPNVVARPVQDVTDWTQEIRLSRDAVDGISWMVGIAGSWTHALSSGSFGADRGDLQPNERLTALLATNPTRVGPLSLLNAALVQDSCEQQIMQTKDVETRDSIAAFGMVDVPLASHWRTRVELRAARETQHIDSRYVNFVPNPQPDPPATNFSELTPRFALDFRPAATWYAYGSIARGARSGGTNTTPGLIEEEQQYDPEYNWTTELGLRHQAEGFLEAWQATIYQIDWRDTQILGLSTSPGVNGLVIHNTAGLTTQGLEAQVQLRLGSTLRSRLNYSHTNPRFDQGSDDAGSRAFCGLTKQPPSSNFCAYGPPRTPSNGMVALVPYLDGNLASRTPRDSWYVSLEAMPRIITGGWQLSGDVSFTYQDNVFERPINGASYGAREQLGARLVLQRGGWRAELWGSNLGDDSYIRAASSRGGVFYPSLPRPLDLLYGEGRRVGLTVSLNFTD
jgi:iron complex outermembrane recepter protein